MKKLIYILPIFLLFISCGKNENKSDESNKNETSYIKVESSSSEETNKSTIVDSSIKDESESIDEESKEESKSSIGDGELPSDGYSWSPISWAR